MVAALEAVVRSAPSAAPEATPVLGRTEGVIAEGPSDTAVVTKEAGRELSLVLTSGAANRLRGMSPCSRGGVH